jgi:serine/threonine-protein kinase RsbW
MMRAKTREISFPSRMENIHEVERFIEEICDANNISNNFFGNIVVAVTEAANNAILHGNKSDPTKKVTIGFTYTPACFSFVVRDEGKGFEYQCVPELTKDPSATKEFPGRGLYLMKSLSDEVRFSENGSTVELIFKTSGINYETTVDRIKKLLSYSKATSKKVTS